MYPLTTNKLTKAAPHHARTTTDVYVSFENLSLTPSYDCKNTRLWQKFKDKIPQKVKKHPSKLVKSIIHLATPEVDELKVLKYIDHTCHNTPRDTS